MKTLYFKVQFEDNLPNDNIGAALVKDALLQYFAEIKNLSVTELTPPEDVVEKIKPLVTDILEKSGAFCSCDSCKEKINNFTKELASIIKPEIKLPVKYILQGRYAKSELHFQEGYNNCLNKFKLLNNL